MTCGSAAVTQRLERTAQGYRRFRCHVCGMQSNEERTGGLLNRTQYPSDVVALVVFWRLRDKLALRDLPEMFLVRGLVFSHEAVREGEAKLTPALAEELRRRRRGKTGRRWYVDETCIKVQGRWCYPYPLASDADAPGRSIWPRIPQMDWRSASPVHRCRLVGQDVTPDRVADPGGRDG